MMKNKLIRVIAAACIAVMISQPPYAVMAAEETPVMEMPKNEMPEMEAPVMEVPEMPQPEPVDHETALLQEAQRAVVEQGLALDKYHVINVLGDSLTEGVGARSEDKAYPVVLSGLTGAVVNNYGVSGSRITDIESIWTNPGSFVDRMYAMDKAADLVLVFGGTNDFWFGDCPIGKRSDTGEIGRAHV